MRISDWSSDVCSSDLKLIREPGSNGLALGADGALRIADSGTRAPTRVDLASKRRTILVDRYRGKRVNSPKDLALARSGAVYFTHPPYRLPAGAAYSIKELDHNGVSPQSSKPRLGERVDKNVTS